MQFDCLIVMEATAVQYRELMKATTLPQREGNLEREGSVSWFLL